MISLSHESIKALPDSPVKLPHFSKRILPVDFYFSDHGSHVIPKVGGAN